MRMLVILIGSVLAAAVAFIVSIYVASEVGGEVVVLERKAPDGSTDRVRLWVVDDQDAAWIEHGAVDSHWMAALTADPTLVLERKGEPRLYRAYADPGMHKHYHDLRRQKYGFADWYVGLLGGEGDACQSVPVRIEAID